MEKTKLGFVRFFNGYFRNLHKLILTNILFAVPASIFVTLFYMISKLSGLNLSVIELLPIIFCFPFFAGVTVITRNIAREDKQVPVVKLYFKGLKENFLRFLVHGIIYYIAFFLCYISIALYWRNAQINNIYFLPFGITVLITTAVLFIAYNVPTMTVTFKLKMGTIYKNSALMSFGELKNNFFATIGLFLLFLFIASIYLVIPDLLIRNIFGIALFVILVPSTASYIINFYVFKDMARMISESGARSAGVKDDEKEEKEEEIYDFSQLDLDENKDMEEYLFFGGKMVKRKTLIKMRDAQEANNEQEKVKKD
ncbi:MAG: YesL family protein [Ruminococcus sp.]|nr:YesL family protein [Ruminococcus sp.]